MARVICFVTCRLRCIRTSLTSTDPPFCVVAHRTDWQATAEVQQGFGVPAGLAVVRSPQTWQTVRVALNCKNTFSIHTQSDSLHLQFLTNSTQYISCSHTELAAIEKLCVIQWAQVGFFFSVFVFFSVDLQSSNISQELHQCIFCWSVKMWFPGVQNFSSNSSAQVSFFHLLVAWKCSPVCNTNVKKKIKSFEQPRYERAY